MNELQPKTNEKHLRFHRKIQVQKDVSFSHKLPDHRKIAPVRDTA